MSRRAVSIREPIFLNCMSRGGSNIFWNFFLTHPGACSPIRETVELFRTGWRAPTWAGTWLAISSGQPRLFDQWYLRPRRLLRRRQRLAIDRVLHRNKLLTLTDPEMRFKNRDETYTLAEVERARLVTKNNNGLIFLNDNFRQIYPDATFFNLVRHPVALYESHKRRRLWRSPEDSARFYHAITDKMLADVEGRERCFLTRFEDLLADPLETLRRVYAQAGLEHEVVHQVRLRSKKHYQPGGARGSAWEIGRHFWLDFDEVPRFLDAKINERHIDRLSPGERESIVERTSSVLERLGYGP